MPELHGLLRVADEHLRASRALALVNAEDRELADERVAGDLEDVRQERLARIVPILEGLLVRAVAGHERAQVAFLRAGEMLRDRVEQLAYPDVVLRIRKEDRHDVPLVHRALERRVQRRVVRLLAAEVLLHQAFVQLDDLVEHRRVRGSDRAEVALAALVQEALDDRLAVAGRQVDGQTLVSERLLNPRDERLEIDFRRVDLVDHDRARQVALARGLEHAPRHDLDAADRVDHDHTGLDGRHARQRRADQVRRSGRVDDVDPLAEVVGVQDGRVDRVLVLALLLLKVGEAVALGDRSPAVDGAGGVQQGIDERRLPAAAVTGEEHVANVGGGVTGHERKTPRAGGRTGGMARARLPNRSRGPGRHRAAGAPVYVRTIRRQDSRARRGRARARRGRARTGGSHALSRSPGTSGEGARDAHARVRARRRAANEPASTAPAIMRGSGTSTLW